LGQGPGEEDNRSFDTLTSLAGAKVAAARLANATTVSIPGIGPFVSPASPCAQTVVVSFFDLNAPTLARLRAKATIWRALRGYPFDGAAA
jgi:hypothetical protein